MSELEKVISICDKKLATTEEILDGCAYTCPIQIGFKDADVKKGLLSCSFTETGRLALCIWQETQQNKFQKIVHIAVPFIRVTSLKGIIDFAIYLGSKVAVKNE